MIWGKEVKENLILYTTVDKKNNNDAIVMLTTASGNDRCVSIVSITNSQDYISQIETLLNSVELKPIEQFGSQKLLVVNGMVGNMKYTEVKSAGQFTVLNNWQVRF